MPRKTKTPQPEDIVQAQGRDLFQTPNYAVDLLIPFIPWDKPIWEPAAGLGKIVKRLEHFGFKVQATDICYDPSFNFLTESMVFMSTMPIIVTNTPFSLKKKFFLRCLDYKTPFALLMPADYSSWVIDAMKMGAEKIVPERRIDYITPNTLNRIHEGEIWENFLQEYHEEYKTLRNFQYEEMSLWEALEKRHREFFNYKTIYDAPPKLLRKYSSSDFHSMWLTWGLNIGKQETYVELTNEMKDNI